MALFKFFRAAKSYEEVIQREKACIAQIKHEVSQKCGIDNFIDNDDSTVAFSGTKSNMELLLEIITQKYDGQNYLYASVDDEVSWHEWDFDNIDEFIRNISEYISNRVNRTIKTVTEVSNKNFRISSYYLNEDGEWVCFEDHDSHSRCFCFIMNHLTESKEIIKVYRLSPF